MTIIQGLSKLIWGSLAILSLVLLLLYLQGTFTKKVPPGTTQGSRLESRGPTATVVQKTLPVILSWPASVVSATVADIAPKVPGRILNITVNLGDAVQPGQLLVQLDSDQIRAQWQAAQASLTAAQAQAARASADARRIRNLFAKESVTRQELDAALAAERATRAQVEEAHHRVEAIQAQLEETELRAPFAGSIIARRADPGDLALPGQTLLVLQDPRRTRVETAIPERCAHLLKLGDPLDVEIPSHGFKQTAAITEMSAAADPLTHTVLVKVSLPAYQPITPGAFAWVRQACGMRVALLLPAVAVHRAGQLEEVVLVTDGAVQTRLVRTGRHYDGQVEILAGLKAGDQVLLPEEE